MGLSVRINDGSAGIYIVENAWSTEYIPWPCNFYFFCNCNVKYANGPIIPFSDSKPSVHWSTWTSRPSLFLPDLYDQQDSGKKQPTRKST